MQITLTSFIFLLALFYARFIPLEIFWKLYFIFKKILLPEIKPVFNIGLFLFLTVSHLIALFVLVCPFLWVANYVSRQDLGKNIFSFFLITSLSKVTKHDRLYFLLLSNWLNNLRKVKCLYWSAQALKLMALLATIIGAIETTNSIHSHVNPDIFDWFFPENGAYALWGGLTGLSFGHFLTGFLLRIQSASQQRKRLAELPNLPEYLKNIVFSSALSHKYFYLPRKERIGLAKDIK